MKQNKLDIRNQRRDGICIFCFSNKGVKFDITMPELKEVVAPGSSEIQARGFAGEKLRLEITGASKAKANVDYEDISIRLTGASHLDLVSSSTETILADVSGAASLNINGKSEKLEADVGGASKLRGFDMIVGEAIIEVSGASLAELNVIEELNTVASGASKVYYLGEPEIIKEISGSSKIINKY